MGRGAQAPIADDVGGVSFIPSPFFAGECPRCRGEMRHDCWDQDEEWQEFRRPPKGTRVFLVPNEAKAREYARVNYGGAELVLAD